MSAAEARASQPLWHAAFKLLFEMSATPVAILDERRCVVELNAAAEELLGRAGCENAGERAGGAIAVPERERSEADWRQLLRDGRMSGTRTLIRADASEVQVVFAAVVEAVAGGRRAIYTLKPARGGESASAATDAGMHALTNRESQVVRLIACGMDTSDIAARLHVSPNTVRSHVRNAMSKLSARTRAQLVAHAFGGDTSPAGKG